MNNGSSRTDSGESQGPEDMDDIGTLIKLAGQREQVPPHRFARARDRVHSHWEDVVQAHDAKPLYLWPRYLALAATVVVTLSGLLIWRGAGISTTSPVAQVERVQGDVFLAGEPVLVGTSLTEDARIETASGGRLALRLSGGQSLRLDEGTQLLLAAADQVALNAGAIYFDVGPDGSAGPINVETPLGVARDVGTQFQVRLQGAELIVGVREGLVQVTQAGRETLAVQAGEFLQLDQSGSEDRRDVPVGDPRWDWVESIAPTFDLEGATLESFLHWFARERGLALRFTDDTSQEKAQYLTLSGNIEGLSVDAAMDAVSRTSRFTHTTADATLSVTLP